MTSLHTLEHKKVIFFDMNRTLLDPQRAFRDSFLETLQDYIGRWQDNDDFAAEKILQTYLEQWQKQRRSKGNTAVPLEQIRRSCLAHAFQSIPIPNKERFLRIFWQQARTKQDQSPRLYKDVRETLEQLHEKSYKLAIISNGSKLKQEQQLKHLKLQALIPDQHLFSSQQGGLRKPNPQLFRHALQMLRIPASQAVMVGDSWKNDIVGATNAGMDAIWIRPLHSNKQNPQRKLGSRQVMIIRHFSQLNQLL
ncbi:MAG: HAD family hydrolase [Paenibacillaceae bacterium]